MDCSFCLPAPENGAQEALLHGRGRPRAIEELLGQPATVTRGVTGQCQHGELVFQFLFSIGFLFLLSALTRESDCAECHCRAAVPTDGREAQREPRAAVLLPGMDRHAEQAQTCAGGRARWNQQFLFHQRAGRLDGRARYNVRAGSRTFRGTTGKMSPQVSASAHRD